MNVVTIETVSGRVTPRTRPEFADVVRSLPDGFYRVVIERVRDGYRKSRYKYYWAHVLPVILYTCQDMIEVMKEEGTFRPVRNTNEIHELLKMKYCPVFIKTPVGVFQAPKSTTELSDSSFIGQFEEAIMAEFSNPPFNCEFMHRDEWAEMMKNK